MRSIFLALVITLAIALPAVADRDDYYCVGPDYLAKEFRSFSTPGLAGPHVVKIACHSNLPDYQVPERIYQYNLSVQREFPGRFVATAAYVGSQGRNLFLRSIANTALGNAAGQFRPGQPLSFSGSSAFGTMTSTVERSVGLGTSRQIQFALRLNF